MSRRLHRRYGRAKSASYVALVEVGPGPIHGSPDPRVSAKKVPGGYVRLLSDSHAAIVGVLINFVGLSRDEAEAMIEER
jgi:hypothetical protein